MGTRVETAAFNGLRAGELAGLYAGGFNPFKRSLSVDRSASTNSGGEDGSKSEAGPSTVDDVEPALCRRLSRLTAGMGPSDYLLGWDDHGTSRPRGAPADSGWALSPYGLLLGWGTRRRP